MNEIRIGRALQLTGLENAKNKVTIGFKTEAKTKIQLAREANENGLTLSEYIDCRLAIRHDDNTITEVKEIIKPDPKTLADLETLKKMYQNAINKLKFYENDFLLGAFNKYKGQTIEIMENDQKSQLTIDSIEATYSALISTIKLK